MIVYKNRTVENYIRLTFQAKAEVYFRFQTPTSNREVKCFIAIDCLRCGKFRHRALNKKAFNEKLDRIKQLQMYLGEIMILSGKTKSATFLFSDSKFFFLNIFSKEFTVLRVDFTCLVSWKLWLCLWLLSFR